MLDEWIDEVMQELGIDDALDADAILDLARVVAHAVERRAAPVTTYILGLAVARGTPLDDAAARITALAGKKA